MSDINLLQKKLAYYKHLQLIKPLTQKQQQAFETYSKQLDELKSIKTADNSTRKQKYIDYLKRNNENAKQRYHNSFRYNIGELKFKTQKEANEYFQNYLKTHENIVDEHDLHNIICLIERHPIGFNPLTQHVEIRKNDEWFDTNNFAIVDNNTNEVIKFLSVMTCIRGKSNLSSKP